MKNTFALAAVANIKSHIRATQATLDAEYQQLLAQWDKAVRASPLEGVEKDSPIYPLACLISNELITSDKDGPAATLPEPVLALVGAARDAGLLPVDYSDISIGGLTFRDSSRPSLERTGCAALRSDCTYAFNRAAKYAATNAKFLSEG